MIFQVQDNTIIAYGVIYDGNGMEFVSLFSQLEGKYSQITVKMHSYGGSVFDGNLIYNTIQNSKKDIDFIIIGIAASMAAIISQSRKDKKPKMVRNGFMMIHAPSGSTYGGALDHENNAKLLRSIENTLVQTLSSSLSKPKAYVAKWMVGDNWFDAEEALKEGLISEIIDAESETLTASLNPKELGAEGMYYQFTALVNPENSKINLDTDMKKPLIEALGLQGVTAESSDTAIIDAVRKHYEGKTSKLETDLAEAKKKQKEAEDKLGEQGKAAITAVLEQAKKDGKITAEQTATYEAIGTTSGIEALNTVLAAIPARRPITSQISNAGGNAGNAPVGRETWDWDKWQKEDPKGFEALSKENPEAWTALYDQKYKK
ncbi:Clp protease ClpP [Flavobacterium columnare]|uniref:ATP-dependent Clp protease proteolytic subunit n=1 Tax=Flavobacterium columnare TaxID=996 RepID=A0AAI8CFN0_9FLAO|nr:Clp protease ClpP [Flavobacterium columnare]AMO19221.1 Clp protease ClpP [Flavobacterium columnare]QOG56172.1 Clp protease ClpP [Flavobacterium columnare]QOG58895.1 Clp protease ClpP [Flavobacterium columnare]QOG61617.1 Clp protease ClpP [Flavobacterium columnare]QOG64339.1 Clp protease ClpP [Flavobacterium columnare]